MHSQYHCITEHVKSLTKSSQTDFNAPPTTHFLWLCPTDSWLLLQTISLIKSSHVLCSTENAASSVCLCWGYLAFQPVHWRADCYLTWAVIFDHWVYSFHCCMFECVYGEVTWQRSCIVVMSLSEKVLSRHCLALHVTMSLTLKLVCCKRPIMYSKGFYIFSGVMQKVIPHKI